MRIIFPLLQKVRNLIVVGLDGLYILRRFYRKSESRKIHLYVKSSYLLGHNAVQSVESRISEDISVYNYRCDNLKSYTFTCSSS
jgi:hypothetical protein